MPGNAEKSGSPPQTDHNPSDPQALDQEFKQILAFVQQFPSTYLELIGHQTSLPLLPNALSAQQQQAIADLLNEAPMHILEAYLTFLEELGENPILPQAPHCLPESEMEIIFQALKADPTSLRMKEQK
jgi:hypothetical protein